jgi:hypothetical protein
MRWVCAGPVAIHSPFPVPDSEGCIEVVSDLAHERS